MEKWHLQLSVVCDTIVY